MNIVIGHLSGGYMLKFMKLTYLLFWYQL